jgi:hypothetical protein
VSAIVVRRLVWVVCWLGIGGMIAASIADNVGAAMTAGLVTAVAALCLIVATAVTRGTAGAVDERAAQDLEARITALVAAGADEAQVRDLVRAARGFGATTPRGKANAEAGMHGGRIPDLDAPEP